MLRRGPVLDSVIQFVDWICRCAGVRYWIRWTNCCAVSLSWFVVVFVVVVVSSRVRSERGTVRSGCLLLLLPVVGTWIGVAVVVEFDPTIRSVSISLTSCSCFLLLLNSIRCTTRSVSISRPVPVLLSAFFLLYY